MKNYSIHQRETVNVSDTSQGTQKRGFSSPEFTCQGVVILAAL